MIKTLQKIMKQDKEKFIIPKGVQQAIQIRTIWPDGIFRVDNKFSKSFRFEDINYAVASKEDKEAMFLSYSELLNSFDSGATTKITINNRRLNRTDFENSILIPLKNDSLDEYRREYNQMLLNKATGANSIVQDKYVTVSVVKKNIEEARNYFSRIGTDLITHFGHLVPNVSSWMPPTGCVFCTTFSVPARKRISTLTCPIPCGKGTTLRITSARTSLNLKKTISAWTANSGVSFSCGNMPATSRTAWYPNCAT